MTRTGNDLNARRRRRIRAARQLRRGRLVGVAVFAFIFLLIAAKFSGQLFQAASARGQVRKQESVNAELKAEIRRLSEESEKLKMPEYIKQFSKQNEFLAEPNEVPIIIYGPEDSRSETSDDGREVKKK